MAIPLETLLRVPHVDGDTPIAVSRRRGCCAFSWNYGEDAAQPEIFEAALEGGAKPRRLTGGPGAKFAPQYAPGGDNETGDRLAYVLDLDGSESYQLIVLDLDSGQAVDLTPPDTTILQPNFAWSPDGKAIAVITAPASAETTPNVSGPAANANYSVYILPAGADGGAAGHPARARAVWTAGDPAQGLDWSPDGRYLAVETAGRGLQRAIYILDLHTQEAFPLAQDGAPLDAWSPAWSPDGANLCLAFTAVVDGRSEIGLLYLDSPDSSSRLTQGHPAAGRPTRRMEWLPRLENDNPPADRQQPAWSPADGANPCLALVEARGANSWLALQTLQGTVRRFRVGLGVHANPVFAGPDHVVFTFESPLQPNDAWRLSLAEGDCQPLTDSLPAQLRPFALTMPSEITYPGLDGTPIPALIYRQPGAEPGPALLNLHGGPNWHYSYHWNPLMAHAASRGWTVLAPNYRGSTGYGQAWLNASRFDLGGADADDCAAGARYLVEQGLAHPQRIAVTGRSHGGYLTMVCLTRFPKLWAAGSAVVPFLNWFTAHQNSRQDLQHWDFENFGRPEEDAERWHSHSPYFFLERVQAPVQLLCGETDPRCPPSESEAARDRLLTLGRQVDFRLYQGEGHVLLKLENILDAEMRRVQFLAQAVEGE